MFAKGFTNEVKKVLERCINTVIRKFKNMGTKNVSLKATLQKPL